MEINEKQMRRNSILTELEDTISEQQALYLAMNLPCFIRVEGGEKRPFFISTSVSDPIEKIQQLYCSEEEKNKLIETFQELSPGECLIVLDLDSDNRDNSITDWFTVSV